MKEIYNKNTANYPRNFTDTFFSDYGNRYTYQPAMHKLYEFLQTAQLKNRTLWKRFVEQFRIHSDDDRGWKGEYWGKMMRGACLVYSYTQDEELYAILTETVCDLMEQAEENGRISSYPQEKELDGWDVWCRKYVLLGMQYYLEICQDDAFAKKVVAAMCKHTDYMMEHFGEEKKSITQACHRWRGLNSSSLLEPVVRLYNLTGQQKYLDFASYIVNCGGMDIFNIFEAAYEDKFRPYQYAMTKAYEMISCFEGLLEYYRVTKEPRWKTAVINFVDRILECDYTVIGGCGTTSELFDHSTVRQANTTNKLVKQETCVTVTLMKFLYQVHLLTGDAKYADAFERSFYNAYLGAINTEGVVEQFLKEMHPDVIAEPLPFDSYSPLTAGMRGYRIGGFQKMPDKHYYGCCACIGSAGAGLVPKMQLLTTKEGFAINLFLAGTVQSKSPEGKEITFETVTDYPCDGKISVKISMESSEHFAVLVRNPAWSSGTKASVNGTETEPENGYFRFDRIWQNGDTIELELDMQVKVIRPIPYGHEILMNKAYGRVDYVVPTYDVEDPLAKRHIALQRGPVMLAQDSRLGYSLDTPVSVCVSSDETVAANMLQQGSAPYCSMMAMEIPLSDGRTMAVTDYASAGKLYTEKSMVAVWMLTE